MKLDWISADLMHKESYMIEYSLQLGVPKQKFDLRVTNTKNLTVYLFVY